MIDRTDRLWERLEKLVVQWRGIGPDDEAVRTRSLSDMTLRQGAFAALFRRA